MQRYHYRTQTRIDHNRAMCCAKCGEVVLETKDILKRTGKEPLSSRTVPIYTHDIKVLQTFRNPDNEEFEIFTTCHGRFYDCGEPTERATWFEGFAWNYAHCPECYCQLGWKYHPSDNQTNDSFYGIIIDRVVGNPFFCGKCNRYIASASDSSSKKCSFAKKTRENATQNEDCEVKVPLYEIKHSYELMTVTVVQDAHVLDSEKRTMDRLVINGYAQSEVTCFHCKSHLGWKHVPQGGASGTTLYTLVVFRGPLDKAITGNDHEVEKMGCFGVCWKGLLKNNDVISWIKNILSSQRRATVVSQAVICESDQIVGTQQNIDISGANVLGNAIVGVQGDVHQKNYYTKDGDQKWVEYVTSKETLHLKETKNLF